MTSPDTINAAVIGCGQMGCSFDDSAELRPFTYSHAATYAEHRSINLLSLYDINPRASQHYSDKYNCHSAKSLKEIFSCGKIDIISICTPPSQRLHLISQCIDQGVRAVFCEKPLALTLSEGKKIEQLCKSNNVALICNHLRRFSPFYSHLPDFLELDKTPTSISCQYGGGIFNTATHLLDTLHILAGAPLDLTVTSSFRKINDHDFNVDFNLILPPAISCSIQAVEAPLFEMRLIQPERELLVNLTYPFNKNPLYHLRASEKNPIFPLGRQFSPAPPPLSLKYTEEKHHHFMKKAADLLVEYLSGKVDLEDLSMYNGIVPLSIIDELLSKMPAT